MNLKHNLLAINRVMRHYCSKNVPNKKPTVEEKVAGMSAQDLVRNMVKMSDWNKMLVVFSGRFKSKKDVPDYLPFGTVDKERNRVRVKVANIMIAVTAIGFIATAWSGKKAAEAGDSVMKRQLDWHKELSEEARKEQAANVAAIAKTA